MRSTGYRGAWRLLLVVGLAALLAGPPRLPPAWAQAGTRLVGQPVEPGTLVTVDVAWLAERHRLAPPTPAPPDLIPPPAAPAIDAAPPTTHYPLSTTDPPRPTTRPLQNAASLGPSPPPSASFPALLDGGGRFPPDTMGTVGPAHVMTMLNSEVAIQNRAGGTLNALPLDEFWQWALPRGQGAYDPRLVYDPYGGRWLAAVGADSGRTTAAVCVGVSRSADPTGLWNQACFDVDPTNQVWADFPTLGFNKDWIVVAANLRDGGVRGAQALALDKARFYAGVVTAFTFTAGLETVSTLVPATTLDADLDTLLLLRLVNRQPGTLAKSVLTGVPPAAPQLLLDTAFLASPQPWNSIPQDFAPQVGSSVGIDTGDDRLHNVVYRLGSLWTAQTVGLPADGAPTHTAVQWWQVDGSPQGTAVWQWGRLDDPTATATNGGAFYAFPSLAVNRLGDVLLGYSGFSSAVYASAGYSLRSWSDPPNTLRQGSLLKAGEGVYWRMGTGVSNRWGDYSHTVVDPLDDLSLWTVQEYAVAPAGPGRDAGRWGTWWGQVVPPLVATYTPTATPTATATPTGTPTVTLTPTVTPTPTGTPTPTPTATPTPTPTATALPPRPARPAVFRAGVFLLRDTLTSGPADHSLEYGRPDDLPLLCDWDGDGSRTLGVYRPSTSAFYLRNANAPGDAEVTLLFGRRGDIPTCGDWDGDGVETVGVFRPSNAALYLRNSLTSGPADRVFLYGDLGDTFVAGDWNGDRVATPGARRGATWFLRQTNSDGEADLVFDYGVPTDLPVVGDWDADGTSTPGVFRAGAWFLRGSHSPGPGETVFAFGLPGDTPLVWR